MITLTKRTGKLIPQNKWTYMWSMFHMWLTMQANLSLTSQAKGKPIN